MKRVAPNRIQELRLEKKKWNQKELADEVRAHWVTISKLERGQMKLTLDWMERIAKALGVEPTELISDPPLDRTVYIEGRINSYGYMLEEVHLEDQEAAEFHIDIGTVQPNVSVWYFADDYMFGVIQYSDLLRFTYFQGVDPIEYLGRLCILEFDAPHAPIAGMLSKVEGSGSGIFDLTVPNGKKFEGFSPERVSVLTMIVADPKFLTDEHGVP